MLQLSRLILGAALLTLAHGETIERLAPVAQTNVLDLLDPKLRTPSMQVMEVAAGKDGAYFLLGCTCGRPQGPNVVFHLGNDGAHRAMPLPMGPARGLGVDADGNVHVLSVSGPRAPVNLLSCAANLDPASCRQTPLGDIGAGTLAVRHAGKHVVRYDFSGAISVDGEAVFKPERAVLPGMPLLLASPARQEVVYVDRAAASITTIDPERRLAAAKPLRGMAIQSAVDANRNVAGAMPVVPGADRTSPNQNLLSIYSAALGPGGQIFAAVSPYDRNDGALLVQIGPDGAAVRTIRCELPLRDDVTGEVITPAHISVAGDKLLLVSGRGHVMTYTF